MLLLLRHAISSARRRRVVIRHFEDCTTSNGYIDDLMEEIEATQSSLDRQLVCLPLFSALGSRGSLQQSQAKNSINRSINGKQFNPRTKRRNRSMEEKEAISQLIDEVSSAATNCFSVERWGLCLFPSPNGRLFDCFLACPMRQLLSWLFEAWEARKCCRALMGTATWRGAQEIGQAVCAKC